MAFIVRRGENPGGAGGGVVALGSESADDGFAALIESHSRLLFRIALAVVHHRQDAEDVVQETFLQVYRRQRWAQIDDVRGYLARVTWRLAVRRKKERVRELELPLEVVSSRAGADQSMMDRQLEAWIHQRIDALPETLRQPLVLAALGELRLVDIAKILHLPEGTVRRRVHDARSRIRQELMERNGGPNAR